MRSFGLCVPFVGYRGVSIKRVIVWAYGCRCSSYVMTGYIASRKVLIVIHGKVFRVVVICHDLPISKNFVVISYDNTNLLSGLVQNAALVF